MTQPRTVAAVYRMMTARRLPLIALLLGLGLATCVERMAPAQSPVPGSRDSLY